MDFLELAKKRCSVRSYQKKSVEPEKLQKILEAGRVAPTGVNRQPQHLLVIQSPKGLEKLSRAARIFGAPLAIIVCADTNQAWIRPYDKKQISDIDASIVTDHMMLEATDLGLGSVWVCYFKPDILIEEFQIPDHLIPVNILLIGYPQGDLESPDRHDAMRKPLEETVSYESFSGLE